MGRSAQTEPPIPVEFLTSSFGVRQDGALLRAASARGDLVGEPATYRDGDGVLRVRLAYRGKKRSMTAARVGWILATGSYPRGVVATIGAADDFRLENLVVVPHCGHKPQSGAGKASSLERRQEADAKLLVVMVEHEGASLMQLSRLAGVGEARTSTRLTKLAAKGLAESPRCCPGKAWALTDRGRAVAMEERPLLDDTDRQVLATLARSPTPMRQLGLARRCGTCSLTIKRRAAMLAHRGLIAITGPQFRITPAGIEVLGEDAKPLEPWIRTEAISAASAKDVTDRRYVVQQTAEQRSQHGKLARASAKRNRSMPFNGGGYFERIAS